MKTKMWVRVLTAVLLIVLLLWWLYMAMLCNEDEALNLSMAVVERFNS